MADIYWTGYVQDAQKELVEACCTLALVKRLGAARPAALGIAPAAFLNGLGRSGRRAAALRAGHAAAG